MANLRIAILGASGIGKFHAREFKCVGADVVAILGSSKESAEKTVSNIFSEYGIRAKPYFVLEALLAAGDIDAVSVCTPDTFHYAQVKDCLTAGLHVMSEKPFVRNSTYHNSEPAIELVELAKKKNLVLTVNTQWPSVLRYVQKHLDLSRVKSFSMHTQPESMGIDMLAEQLSHQNSMVIKLISGGHAEDMHFLEYSKENIRVSFKYTNNNSECTIEYRFTHKRERPRNVTFSFDGVEFRREIGENYQQKLVTDGSAFYIEDPLKISIGMFVGAVARTCEPLISKEEIVENIVLQDRIIEEYVKVTNAS